MLRLLSTPGWSAPGGATYDVPDSLPGYLLVYLAYRGDWVTREALATAFWPERSEEAALHNLRANLHRLRVLLAQWGQESALRAERHRVRLDLPTDVAAMRGALARKDWTTVAEAAGDALLATLSFRGLPSLEEWAVAERRVVAGLWRDAALAAARASEQAGEPESAVRLLLRLASAEALTEPAMQDLLRLAAVTGRRAGAIDAFARFRSWLAAELGTQPAAETVALAEALREPRSPGGEAAFPGKSAPAKSDDSPRREPVAAGATDSVPAAAAPDGDVFVGRRTELMALARLLGQPECRLVTILGPGGVGKSSLARRLLAQESARFPGGAVWVELQDLDAMPPVLARLAAQLQVTLNDAQDPLPQIARQLQGRRTLVVLDNAEHLAELAPVLDRLLDAATCLSIVLTSRVRLHGRHERLLPLAGLPVPDEESRDLQAAAAFDAVRLFNLRACAAQRSFDLSRQLSAVIRIVEAVGGLPLAIELAAGWVRLLPVEEIARDLSRAIEVLERDPAAPAATVRPEHASLRAVLQRSWQMLGPGEREAMLALSVFRGGFTRAAAQAVAEVPLPLLSSLVDKSMLAADETGRFDMHPLLAAFAAAGAAAEAEWLTALRTRHAEYFARHLLELAPHARSDHRVLVQGIDGEFANATAAWNAASASRRADLIEMMASPLGAYFDHRGRYGEGAALLRTALDLAESERTAQRALGRVRMAMANLLHRRRDLDEALAIAQTGARLAEASGDRQTLIGCLSHAGSCLSVLGRWTEARPFFERALALARQEGDRPGIAASLMNLGVCAKKDGQLDTALDLYTQSLDQERELAHHAAVGRCLNNIGVLHMERDDWARAREVMADGVRHCDRYQLKSLLPYVTNGLGLAHYELGTLDEAERCFLRAIDAARATEVRVVEQTASCLVARVAARRGRFDEARSRFRDAARLAVTVNSVPDLLDVALYYAEVLRDSGDRLGAYRTWRMVISHERAEAGVRGSSERWAEALALTEAERAEAEREPLALERFVAELTA